MKKFLSVFVTLTVAFVIFAFLTKSAEADKSIFGVKSPEDKEKVKQISLDKLREKVANRAVGNTTDLKAKSVEFDELNMAHTKVRQTVADVPVWEGEAIVHLKADGELASITDELKEDIVVNPNPTISDKDALQIARKLNKRAARQTEEPKVDLWVSTLR